MSQYQNMIGWAAKQYGADPGVLTEIARLESSFRPGVMNDWDSNAKKGTPSGGMFQFIQPTYQSFSQKAMAANPAAWKGVRNHWMDPKAQALTTAWAIRNGLGSHWATYGRAQKAAGSMPTYKGAAPAMAAPQVGSPGLRPTVTGGDRLGLMDGMFRSKDGKDDWFWDIVKKDREASAGRMQQAGEAMGVGGHYFGDGHDHSHEAAVGAKAGQFKSYKDIIRFAKKNFGMQIQGDFQTTGGNHSRGSLHYQGKAVDFGDANTSPKQFQQMAAFVKQNPHLFKQMFYDPLGWYVLNGKIIKGSYGGHGNHMHLGVW